MTKVICVKVSKGGVGKTTISSNLGQSLANRNKKILLIDLDAQSNLSKSFLRTFDENKLTSSNLIGDDSFDLENQVYQVTKNLDLIISDVGLNEAIKYLEKNDEEYINKLKIKFSEEKFLKYEYIILDLSPGVSEILSECAFVASDLILCPMHFDMDSLSGIVTTIDEISRLHEEGLVKESLHYLVVPNRFDKRFEKDNKIIIDMIYNNLEKEFIAEPIRENSHIKKARMRTITAIEYENDPSRKYEHKKAIEDFEKLTKKIEVVLN